MSRFANHNTSNLQTEAEQDAADMAIAKRAAEILDKHYPDHLWKVSISHETGMCNIHNMNLDGEFGYSIYLAVLLSARGEKTLVRGGGELLERFNVSRGKLKQKEIDDLKQNFAGKNVHH